MPSTAVRPANKLLASLREDAYRRIAPKLHRTTLSAKQVLYKPNQSIDEVYFPETAVICLMTVMSNGDTLETATVGVEGASWISASIGAPTASRKSAFPSPTNSSPCCSARAGLL